MAEWYYDPSSGEVVQGKVGSWTNRMGPYATEEEARDALRLAAERNAAADAFDEQDENWGDA